MAELGTSVGISVIAKLAKYLVDLALHEGQCLFCVGKVARDLETRKEELIITEGRVQKDIDEALKIPKEIDGAVKRWKNEVKQVLADVEKLQEELKANNGCFRGWCPTWKRHRLCKQLAKKTETILQLNTNSKFEPFSHPVPIPDVEYFSSGNFMYFKSTKEAEDKLLEALGDDSCYIIGLYAMGGSGKTSLATEVGKKAKEQKIFDHVVFTTVSHKPNVNNIQSEIADILGLRFDENSEFGRASRLSMRLKSGEHILIILYDVWTELDLEKIGIPVEGDQKGCKVLLTTRQQQVCISVNCKTRIPLGLLSEDESWRLFEKHASITDASLPSSMNEVAWGIVRECKVLPIAIVVVGSSLKEKSDDEWNVALDNLRCSKPLDVPPIERDAFACLKLSYDYLKNEVAKSIFLMCGMFPEDQEISIEDLFRCGIGVGVRSQVDSFEIARHKVNVAIKNLIESCLLTFSGQNNDSMKMHDMIRDVALWIASKEKGTIKVNQAKNMNELALDETVKDCYALSSWGTEIDQFPCQLNAPKLEILSFRQHVNAWDPTTKLDLLDVSFEGVKELKVMEFILKANISSFPQSLQWLTNLRTLRLVWLELIDISFVVSLKRLEILDLQHSKFEKLPDRIDKLNKLKLLDLTGCTIAYCCDEVIKRCLQLEELYINGFASIASYECIEDNVAFIKLKKYKVRVGNVQFNLLPDSNFDYSMRGLWLGGFNISTSGKVMKDLLQRACIVWLQRLNRGCRSIIPEMVQTVGCMNELTELHLEDCDEIDCLVNNNLTHAHSFSMDNVFATSLDLTLKHMYNLKEVCRGPPLLSFFQILERLHIGYCGNLDYIFPEASNLCNLKFLKIENCLKLISLFPMSSAQAMLKLEAIQLCNCKLLEYVITNGEGGTNTRQEILSAPHHEDSSSSLNQKPAGTGVVSGRRLRVDSPALQLSLLSLQHLQRLSVNGCGKMECLLSMDVFHKSLQGLIYLSISDCEELKGIIDESEEPHNISNAEVLFPNLKELEIRKCNKLKWLFSSTISRMLPQLNFLHISEAALLEEVFWHKAQDANEKIELPSLRKIRLNKLPSLIDVCSNGIDECPKFVRVSKAFDLMALEGKDGSVSNQLSDLQTGPSVGTQEMSVISSRAERLSLLNLNDLMFVWKASTFISFKSLQYLEVDGCRKLKSIFSATVIKSLPQLEILYVRMCEELEEIISNGDGEEKEGQFLNPSNYNSCPHQVCFPKLRWLQVTGCNKLKSIFPVSMAGVLPQLCGLQIESCSKLELVFDGKYHKPVTGPSKDIFRRKTQHINERIELPNLREIRLVKLPAFVDVCQETKLHAVVLSSICINECPKFALVSESFDLMALEGRDGHVSNEGSNFQAGPSVRTQEMSIISSRVEQLSLLNLNDLMFAWRAPTFISFKSLQYLKVNGCRKLKSIFSATVIKSLPQLEELHVNRCEELEEILSNEDGEDKEGQFLNPSNYNSCPHQVCFPKLGMPEVVGCNKLKSIFPVSMAGHLPRLQHLVIESCSKLEQVFDGKYHKPEATQSEGVFRFETQHIKAKIELPNLWRLTLDKLPALVDVCQGMMLHAVVLINIYINECPKFASVSESFDLMALEGKDGHVSNQLSDFQTSSNLGTQEMLVISRAKWLSLLNLNDLMFIWKGPTFISFKSLYYLKVDGCRKLKSIFSATVFRSLPELRGLLVYECEELEEIISDGDGGDEQGQFLNPSHSRPYQLCFPKLDTLIVVGCNKLKCLFPVSMAGDLPELENLKIERCSNLEQVFGSEVKPMMQVFSLSYGSML